MGNEKSESEKGGGATKEIDTEKNHGKEETSNNIGETETEPAALDEEEAIRGVLSSDYDDHEGDEIARTVYTRRRKILSSHLRIMLGVFLDHLAANLFSDYSSVGKIL